MKESVQKLFYAVLRSQTLSADGRFLFVASSYGDIATFGIEKIAACIENITNDQISDPIATYKCSEKVFSLAFYRDFLIVGSQQNIFGFTVSSSGQIQKKAWTITLPISPDSLEMSEVNDLWVDKENDTIYAACGDSNVYACRLEDKNVRKLSGHTDYIHSVHGHEKLVVSASEDGTVKFWDNREANASFTLEPSKFPSISRPNFGNWVGSASINSREWVAIGGGPRLALFQLRNRQPFQIFDFPKEIHVTDFIDDNLLVGGESNLLCQYSFQGNVISEIETSGPSVLSVVWQMSPQILFACGASNGIDVTTNFTYKDTTLNFYSKDL